MVMWQVSNTEKEDLENYKEKEADTNNCVEAFYRDIYHYRIRSGDTYESGHEAA